MSIQTQAIYINHRFTVLDFNNIKIALNRFEMPQKHSFAASILRIMFTDRRIRIPWDAETEIIHSSNIGTVGKTKQLSNDWINLTKTGVYVSSTKVTNPNATEKSSSTKDNWKPWFGKAGQRSEPIDTKESAQECYERLKKQK